MLKRLFTARRDARAPASVPDGMRVYAIGDIHGRLDLFDDLLALIAADEAGRGPAQTVLVLLGDLVDRGPDSAGVVERVRALSAEREVRLLLGNHEEVFLAALTGKAEAVRSFCRIGGRETVLSYGTSPEAYEAMDYAEVAERLVASVPGAHHRMLDNSEDMVVIGDYAFVHAGVRPGIALEEQRRSDLRWIREPFLSSREYHGKTVVHGHTIVPDPEFVGDRIGIDTGAYATGRLTALGLEGQVQWLLATEPDSNT